jgi:nucleotide-binding universal stress UspA family protein
MSKTILLAVDSQGHLAGAADSISEMVGTGDRVVVLHVHEFAVGKFGRIQVDCTDGEGEKAASDVVAALAGAGVTATAEIRKTPVGHIARTIIGMAAETGAALIVLGSSGSHDLPHLPFGSVSLRVLHRATIPVLIVPRPVGEVRLPVTGDVAAAVS